MAIFRCSQCGHVQETGNEYLNKSVKCPACHQGGRVYPTVPFVKNLVDRYFEQMKRVKSLEAQLASLNSPETDAGMTDSTDAGSNWPSVAAAHAPENIHHTKVLGEAAYYQPVQDWFAVRQIKTVINNHAVDTTGFFDDIAVALGDDLAVLGEVLDKIRYCQRKNFADVKLVLTERSQKEVGILTRFCQQLYHATFVTRYMYQKKERIIRLGVQTAPAVTAFFAGGWLEWYVLMKLLAWCQARQYPFACARNLELVLPNEDRHELDVFFLIDKRVPVCIECKSGEFRQDIDKYVRLRKRIGLEKQAFILCVADLDAAQAEGLGSMYDLSFASPQDFTRHLDALLPR